MNKSYTSKNLPHFGVNGPTNIPQLKLVTHRRGALICTPDPNSFMCEWSWTASSIWLLSSMRLPFSTYAHAWCLALANFYVETKDIMSGERLSGCRQRNKKSPSTNRRQKHVFRHKKIAVCENMKTCNVHFLFSMFVSQNSGDIDWHMTVNMIIIINISHEKDNRMKGRRHSFDASSCDDIARCKW